MTGELSIVREVVAAALLVLMAGCSMGTAALVAPFVSSVDRLERLLVTGLLILAQAVGIPLALGALGLLHPPLVVVTHLAVLGLASWRLRRRGRASAGDLRAIPAGARAWHTTDLAGVAAGTAYLFLGVASSLRRARSLDFDTKEYHLSNLASWLQRGSLWHLPYAQPGSVTATHPGNGEMMGLWLALPTHGDELVYLAPMLFAPLCILAAAVLVRELRGGERGAAGLGALAAVAVLAAPIYLGTQVDSLSTDLPAAAGLLGGVALLFVARRGNRSATVALAGISIGLGLGAKYTAVVPAAVIVAVAVLILRRRSDWWLLVPGVATFAAPWFVRNLVATGNPLFPQDLKVVDGGVTPYNVLNTSILHQILDGRSAIVRSWIGLAADLVGPVLLIVPFALVVAVVRPGRASDRRGLGLLAVVSAGALLAYMATPVTGGGPTGLDFIIASCFRYGLVGVLLTVVCSAIVLGPRLGVTGLTAAVLWDGWQAHTVVDLRGDLQIGAALLAVAVVVAGLVLAALCWGGGRPGLERIGAASAGGLVAVAALVGGFAVIHRSDRGTQLSTLERLAQSFGPDRAAVVVGVGDLRAVLGPRLERPLLGVSRGGRANETPFTDDAQLVHHFLGGPAPRSSSELRSALDAAVAATGADLLIVGRGNPVARPDDWVPDNTWCLVGSDPEGAVFVRPRLLQPGAVCQAAVSL